MIRRILTAIGAATVLALVGLGAWLVLADILEDEEWNR